MFPPNPKTFFFALPMLFSFTQKMFSIIFLSYYRNRKTLKIKILQTYYPFFWSSSLSKRSKQKLQKKLEASDFIKSYQRMWPFIKPFWPIAALSLVMSVPIGSLDAAVAFFLKPYTDTVLLGQNLQSPWYIPLLIVGFTAIQGALLFSSNLLTATVSGRFSMAVKKKLYAKLLERNTAYFDKENSGTIVFRYCTDADLACKGLLTGLKNLVTRVFSSISLVAVLIYNSWQLAIVAVIVMAVAITPLTYVKKLIKSLTTKNATIMGSSITSYNETFAGNRTITAYNLQERQKTKFYEVLEELFQLSLNITKKTAWLSPFMHFIVSIGIALTISLGSWLILSEQISAGNFVSFLAALLMLYTPLKSMGPTVVTMQNSFLAIERIFEIFDAETPILEKSDAHVLEKIEHNVEFRNVQFSYTQDVQTLKGINLDVKVGEMVAIVGNSGGGKSTLVSLLPRFYDVNSGEILIDGMNIQDMTLQSLRNQMSVVFQDNFLFSGTIRDNILCGNQNASDECVQAAVQSACLEDFIASLEHGLETEIGERGVLLSGGQKQRIAIARAFLKNAPILILDEATSALDNKSEKVVQHAIDNLMKDKTVLVIAHRLSTIRNADRIAVIQEGHLVELGRHDELMQIENGQYKQLYSMQFHNAE